MRINNPVFSSAGISFLLHLIFLVVSCFVFLPGLQLSSQKTKLISVKIVKEERAMKSALAVGQASSDQKDKKQLVSESEIPMSFMEPDEKIRKDLSIPVPQQAEPLVVSRRDRKTEYREPKENATVLEKKARKAVRQNLVEVGTMPASPKEAGVEMNVTGDNISTNIKEKSPGSGALITTGLFNATNKNDKFQVTPNYKPGVKRATAYSDLKGTLGFELKTYQDPKDGQKYFRLSVKVQNTMANLTVLPKELVVLVDCSQSIGEKRLAEFKQGLTHVVRNLNKDDRFNIIAFKEKMEPLSSTGALEPTEQNVKAAIQFIKLLSSGSKTNVFNALSETVNRTASLKPAYTIFISDGLPTEGVKDSRQVINQISEVNKGKIPIFAFSGGLGVSRYLLDFVAYKNRGWSEFANRDYFIGRDLGRMYNKIRDPLLINLRYNTSGLKKEELFPQALPDFFKGSELVLFGKYTNEDRFIVQVLGDLKDEIKEFIVESALPNAQKGDAEIARQWAFHKVYHLISLLKPNEESPEILQQIDALCEQFNIETPYSKNYR